MLFIFRIIFSLFTGQTCLNRIDEVTNINDEVAIVTFDSVTSVDYYKYEYIIF